MDYPVVEIGAAAVVLYVLARLRVSMQKRGEVPLARTRSSLQAAPIRTSSLPAAKSVSVIPTSNTNSANFDEAPPSSQVFTNPLTDSAAPATDLFRASAKPGAPSTKADLSRAPSTKSASSDPSASPLELKIADTPSAARQPSGVEGRGSHTPSASSADRDSRLADIPAAFRDARVPSKNSENEKREPDTPAATFSSKPSEDEKREPDTPVPSHSSPSSPAGTSTPSSPSGTEADGGDLVMHLPGEKKEEQKRRKVTRALSVITSDPSFERIDCPTLASWLERGDAPMLIDVRGPDYNGGQMVKAKHLAFTEYGGPEIHEVLTSEKFTKIVFFCMYGKEQSPNVARGYVAADPKKAANPTVYVLHGGFQAWLRYCAKAGLEEKYISGYNQALWVYKEDMGLVYRGDVEEGPAQRAPALRHLRMQSTTLKLSVDETDRFETLEAKTLAGWIESGNWPVIVDVRAEDYKGGFIPKSLHIPFASFTARKGEVTAALRESKGSQKNIVVFLCMYGKEHSPTCAVKFLSSDKDSKAKVFVLRKGFQDWLTYCLQQNEATKAPLRTDKQVAGYDPEKWVSKEKFGMTYAADLQA